MSSQNKIFKLWKLVLTVLISFAFMMLLFSHKSTSNKRSQLSNINSCRNHESISSMENIFNRLRYRKINHSEELLNINLQQPISHFPNLTFLTNKMHLALTTRSKYIPVSFQFPRLKNEFLYFAMINADRKFIIKNFDNGGIKIVGFEEIDFQLGIKQ